MLHVLTIHNELFGILKTQSAEEGLSCDGENM
jgi:hypothetical protein